MTENNDQNKRTPEQVEAIKRALLNTQRYNRPGPEFATFLDTLDALDFDIAVYLAVELKIGFDLVSRLMPLIDRRCFQDRLKFQIDAILKKLEEGSQ